MDFLFCIPIAFGCPTKVSADGQHQGRICPRCHNASVFSAKSRLWFELCFIPLVPMKSKHIWMCSICQWNVPLQQNWEPAVAGQAGYSGPWQGGPWQGPSGGGGGGGGYQPTYLNQHKA